MTYKPSDPSEPPEDPIHKLQIYIPTELFNELGRYFPHGLRRPVFQCLAEDLLKKMKETGNPDAVCASIITGDLRLEFRGKE